MSDPFIGEIRLFAFGRAPIGWVLCAGQPLAIAQYQVLYTLIGTTYGGDGVTTFNAPDLRGRVPIRYGQGPGLTNHALGQPGGEERHTLLTGEIPAHGHALLSSLVAGQMTTPGPSVHLATAQPPNRPLYAPTAAVTSYATMASQSIQPTGGNGSHDNMMPSLVMNYCIATDGIYPSN